MPVHQTLPRLVLALVVALSSLTAARSAAASSETFRWQGQVAPGQTVEVRGINGVVRAEPSSSGQVELTAVKTGREDDPRGVRIVVVPHPEGVTICAVYPDVDGERNECRPGGGGRNNVRDNDVQV